MLEEGETGALASGAEVVTEREAKRMRHADATPEGVHEQQQIAGEGDGGVASEDCAMVTNDDDAVNDGCRMENGKEEKQGTKVVAGAAAQSSAATDDDKDGGRDAQEKKLSWQEHEYVMLRPLKAASGSQDEGGDAPVTWSKTFIASGMKLNESKAAKLEQHTAGAGVVGANEPAKKSETELSTGNRADEQKQESIKHENGAPKASENGSHGDATIANTIVTSWKGYRMARASHGISAHERKAYVMSENKSNAWYCELNIVHLGRTGHCRVGFSTASGELGAPVGYDQHSYGYRDLCGTKVHKAQREKYGEDYVEGDVIGMYIHLPPPPVSDDAQSAGNDNGAQALREGEKSPELVRWKGGTYSVERVDADENACHEGSVIAFSRNGESQGVAFRDLLRGTYYAAASVYTLPEQSEGASIQLNAGPDFRHKMLQPDGCPEPRALCELRDDERERIRIETEHRMKLEEEARLAAEEKARVEAEEKARMEAEEKARVEAEEKARMEAEEKERMEAEEKARLDAMVEVRLDAMEEVRREETTTGQDNDRGTVDMMEGIPKDPIAMDSVSKEGPKIGDEERVTGSGVEIAPKEAAACDTVLAAAAIIPIDCAISSHAVRKQGSGDATMVDVDAGAAAEIDNSDGQ